MVLIQEIRTEVLQPVIKRRSDHKSLVYSYNLLCMSNPYPSVQCSTKLPEPVHTTEVINHENSMPAVKVI